MKTFWEHENGKVYTVEHDSFGNIIGAAGPLEAHDLQHPSQYRCGPGIVDWVKDAIARRTLHRMTSETRL